MTALEHRVPPPVVFSLCAVAMWALALFGPTVAVAPGLRYGVAVGLVGLGVFISVSGVLAFRRAQTTLDPVNIERATHLVNGAILQRTRNPMYLGLAIMLSAWAVSLAAPTALLGPLAFVLFITRFQIIPEERVMLSKFGSEYEAYRRQVRRWI